MTDADPDVSLSERVVMGLSPPGIGRRHREADLRKLPDRPSPGEPTANVGDRQVFGGDSARVRRLEELDFDQFDRSRCPQLLRRSRDRPSNLPDARHEGENRADHRREGGDQRGGEDVNGPGDGVP